MCQSLLCRLVPECAASFELGVSGGNIKSQLLQLLLLHLPSSMDTLPFIPNKDQGKKTGKGVEENVWFKELNVGFPGGSMGMNCQCRRHRFDPLSGQILHGKTKWKN